MNKPKFAPKECKFESSTHCRKCTMKKVCAIYLSWDEPEEQNKQEVQIKAIV